MKSRSIFGPLVLITIGVLWLLGLTNTIALSNLWALAHMVPFALIAIGIGLLMRAVWPAGGMIISILIVAGIILGVVFAPQLGWNKVPRWAMNWDIGDNIGGGVTGSGNVISETHAVQGIDTVQVSYPSEVTIQQGDDESITIEAEDNLVPQLNTRVVSGRLEIRNTESDWNKRVNPTEDVKVSITVKDLRQVQFSTAGSLRIDGLETDTLEIDVSGVGSIRIIDLVAERLDYQVSGVGNGTVDGEVERLELHMSGLGDFDARDLSVQAADVSMSGAGSATLWVVDDLNVSISGAGSLKYYGNPRVSQQISGAGSVNRLGDK